MLERNEPLIDWAEPELAIEHLHERYARQLLGFAMSMVRQREDAEDIVQIAFLNAYSSISGGYRPELPSAWLHRIVRNACLNRIRTHSRRPATSLDGIDVPERRGIEEQLDQQLDVAALRSALELLPEQQRKAIVLRELRGATYAEIADVLRTSEGAVESLIFRARRRVASSIGNARRPRALAAA